MAFHPHTGVLQAVNQIHRVDALVKWLTWLMIAVISVVIYQHNDELWTAIFIIIFFLLYGWLNILVFKLIIEEAWGRKTEKNALIQLKEQLRADGFQPDISHDWLGNPRIFEISQAQKTAIFNGFHTKYQPIVITPENLVSVTQTSDKRAFLQHKERAKLEEYDGITNQFLTIAYRDAAKANAVQTLSLSYTDQIEKLNEAKNALNAWL